MVIVYSRIKVVVILGSVNAVVRPVACRYRFEEVAVGRTTVAVKAKTQALPAAALASDSPLQILASLTDYASTVKV